MRIVIVGASRFGIATAQQLQENGHEVVVIDTDEAKLERLSEQLDSGLIHGDGSLPTVQRDAYADHADALVLLTNEDDVNILAAVVGRSVGFERVIPQIVRAELLAVCDELGMDDVITPHMTVARSIVRALEGHNDASFDLRFQKNINVASYAIGGPNAGKTVGELGLPEATRVIAVTREEKQKLVTNDTELAQGDHLIVAVERAAQEETDACFAEDARSDDEES